MMKLNSLAIKDCSRVNEQLIEWLIDKTKQYKNMTLIPCMTKADKPEVAYKALVEDVNSRLSSNNPSYEKKKNIKGIASFKNKDTFFGVCLVFGNENKLSFDIELRDLYQKAFSSTEEVSWFTLSLIRLCLAFKGFEPVLTEKIELENDIELTLGRQSFAYSFSDQDHIFSVNVQRGSLRPNEVNLSVVSPKRYLPKDSQGVIAYKHGIYIFDYDCLRKNTLKKPSFPYIQHRTKQADECEADKYIDEQANTRVLHEYYWSKHLENLLEECGIEFVRPEIQSSYSVYTKPENDSFGYISKNFGGLSLSNTQSFAIYFDDSLYKLESFDEQEALQSLQKLSVEKLSDGVDVLLTVSKTPEFADIYITQFTSEEPWISSSRNQNLDTYGQIRLNSILNNSFSPMQSVFYETLFAKGDTNNPSKDVFKRTLFEVIQKRELLGKKAPVSLSVQNVSLDNDLNVHYYSCRRVKQSENTKMFNFFGALASFEIQGENIRLLESNTFGQIGVNRFGNNFIDLIEDFELSERVDNFLDTLAQLDEKTRQKLNALYKNNGISFIFIERGGQITQVFIGNAANEAYEYCDLELDISRNIRDEIRKGLMKGAFSKKKMESKVRLGFRDKGSEAYEVYSIGSCLYIPRKVSNPGHKNNKIWQSSYEQVYRAEPLTSNGHINEKSIYPLIVALGSDVNSSSSHSGVKKTLYEKIFSLLVSD